MVILTYASNVSDFRKRAHFLHDSFSFLVRRSVVRYSRPERLLRMETVPGELCYMVRAAEQSLYYVRFSPLFPSL